MIRKDIEYFFSILSPTWSHLSRRAVAWSLHIIYLNTKQSYAFLQNQRFFSCNFFFFIFFFIFLYYFLTLWQTCTAKVLFCHLISAKQASVKKIERIVRTQFQMEIENKEAEVTEADQVSILNGSLMLMVITLHWTTSDSLMLMVITRWSSHYTGLPVIVSCWWSSHYTGLPVIVWCWWSSHDGHHTTLDYQW